MKKTAPEKESDRPGRGRMIIISLDRIIRALFVQPQALLPLALESWPRSCKTALAAIIVCAALLTVSRGVTAFNAAQDWGGWLESRIEHLIIHEDKLEWRQPKELPATFWKDSYRIDFAARNSEFKDSNRIREGSRGIWISPHEIYWWSRRGNNEIIARALWREGRLLDQIETSHLFGEEKVLAAGEFVPQIKRWLWQIVMPFLFLSAIIHLALLFFFYTLIFTLVPFVMRGQLKNYGFPGVHSFYLYAGIPPLLVATVYKMFPLPWLDFNSLFLIGFLIYLGFLAWQGVREYQPADSEGGEK